MTPANPDFRLAQGSALSLAQGEDDLFHLRRTLEEPVGIGILLILALSLFDAGSTLYLLETGVVVEANPIMRRLIEWHPALFALAKQWVTGFSLALAACLTRPTPTGWIPQGLLLRGALLAYLAVFAWHLHLLVEAG